MALRGLSLIKYYGQLRQMHVSAKCFQLPFFNKPLPRAEDMAVGYQKIINEAAKEGEDPLEVERETFEKVCGIGTYCDPFVIPSRETRRFVLVENGPGPYLGFWVTLADGGRCPITARYFRLEYDPEDKWGVDEYDLFAH